MIKSVHLSDEPYLVDRLDYDVSIVTISQKGRPYYFPVSAKVKKTDLNINTEAKNAGQEIKREYKKKLTEYLFSERCDICISTGCMELFFLTSIHDGSKKIVEFHFAFDINEQWIKAQHQGLLWYLIGKMKTIRLVYFAKKFDKVIVLTKSDEKKWRVYTNKVIQIPNPITISTRNKSLCENRQVIAVGRLDSQKGFDYLIDAWKFVSDKYPNWILKIFGDGDKTTYQNQIDNNKLSRFIQLMGETHSIEQEYTSSSIFVLSSRYEGFSLSIMEAMFCGLPVVSYNCPSGPSELVSNGENGFLIDTVGDIKGLSNGICSLIENVDLRKKMGAFSIERAKPFSIDEIMKKWNDLFISIK